MKKKIMTIAFFIIMAIMTASIRVDAKTTKSTKIDEYLSASFDVYNIPIVESLIEFKEMVNNGDITPCIEDMSEGVNKYSFKAKQNGCLAVYNTGYFNLFESSTKNLQLIKADSSTSFSPAIRLIPVRAGDAFTIETQKNRLTVYTAFIPESKTFNIDESKKNSNGTLQFTFGNVYENKTVK